MRAVRLFLSTVRSPTVVAVVLAVALAVGMVSPAPAAAEPDPAGAWRLDDLVDRERGAHGLEALRVCADLSTIARRWSARMAESGRLSHNPHLGSAVGGWQALGEIVGYGTSVDNVHRGFMASPDHRAKILSSTYTEMGVGVERHGERLWVTEVYRQPDGSVPCSVVGRDPHMTTACPPGRVPSAGFVDTRGNTHRDAIDCGAWYDILHGTGGDRYSPSLDLTRAQMATFLTRLLNRTTSRLPAPRDQGFTDIAGDVHADAINQLAAAGIVRGTSASTFAPSAVVTRAQMATFVVRAYEFASGEDLPAGRDWFTDDGGRVHERSINEAAGAGFLAGTTPTSYSPRHPVGRDQLASILARALNRLVEGGHARLPA